MRKLSALALSLLLNTACSDGGVTEHGSGAGAGTSGAGATGGQSSGGATGSGGGSGASSGGLGSGGTGSGGLAGSSSTGGGGSGAGAGGSAGTGGSAGSPGTLEWLPSWATTIQRTETSNKPMTALGGNTLRQFVWPTVSGSQVRIQLSNERGNGPVDIAKVHIAMAKTSSDPNNSMGAIDAATDKAFTFGGMPNVTIPVGQTVWSDAVDFSLQEIKLTAVSIQFGATVPSDITGHPGARTTSYIANGDAVATETISSVETKERWYFINAIEVMAPADAFAIALLGDSITDGYGTLNDFSRWSDFLTLELKKDPARATTRSVLNFGMGANTLTGTVGGDQDPGTERFKRDVLKRDKIKWLVVMEGVNDINATPPTPTNTLTAAYQDIVTQAEAKGIEVFISPITPMNAANATRTAVNQWIRASANYNAGVDLDMAIRDPNNVDNTLAQYKNDDLHPNKAGYKAMGESIDLTLF
jgi:lysophospholipase L1-like esterase